jgi:hypothetical protein
MAKLDQAKEIVNNTRLAITLLVGTELVLVGALVGYYNQENFGFLFWLGIDVAIFLQFILLFFTRTLILKLIH